jgi:hypothetical protein
MKRVERHKLKENEVSETLREALENAAEYRRAIGIVAIAVIILLAIGGGYWGYRTRTDARSRELLSAALTIAESPVVPPAPEPAKGGDEKPAGPEPGTYPSARARGEALLPKVMEVAERYPSTPAGLAARYYAASTLAALGRASEAVTRYQEVVDRAGSGSFYGRMSSLGMIDAHIDAGQYDRAIALCQALITAKDDQVPIDSLLSELGRAYVAAGKTTEATQTLQRLVKEHPASPFVEPAKARLEQLGASS